MESGIKLPKFINRSIGIFSFFTVLAGFVIFALVHLGTFNKEKAASSSAFQCGNSCPSYATFCKTDHPFGKFCVNNDTTPECPNTAVDCSTPSACNSYSTKDLKPNQTVVCVRDERCNNSTKTTNGYCSVGDAESCLVGNPKESCGCDIAKCKADCKKELDEKPVGINYLKIIRVCSRCNQNFMCDCERTPIKDFNITKTVLGKKSYNAGEVVTFEVVISNTTNEIISQMAFTDSYDGSKIKFLDISGKRVDSAKNEKSSANLKDKILPVNPETEFSIANLATDLGPLSAGESYILTVSFQAKAVTENASTCNKAKGNDGEKVKEDDDCIELPKKKIPPTDR